MKISVFGLGYVGVVTAGCLSDMGHEVIGIDIKEEKVTAINKGKSPIFEKGIEDLISKSVDNCILTATTDASKAVFSTDLSFVCVGTPSLPNGDVNLSYIKKVCYEIGIALKKKKNNHLIVIRSTIPPGTTENQLIPILAEKSNKKSDIDFHVCYHPEFLREGNAIYDFYNPEIIVIGESYHNGSSEVIKLYEGFNADKIVTDIKIAEMIKYVNNTFHGIKVTFANEIGRICKQLQIDSHKLMDVFCRDKKLNLSSYYLKPGFAFGGSCLPKEIRALVYNSKTYRISLPLINSILESNDTHIDDCVELVTSLGKRRIGILGLSFKSGTSDLRESPIIKFFNKLYGIGYNKMFDKGFEIMIYDPNIDINDLSEMYPYLISSVVSTMKELVENSEVIIIATSDEEFMQVLDIISENQILVDFVRLIEKDIVKKGEYIGIAW